MTIKHLISMLAVLLVLASCVCTVSAINLNVGSVTLPNLVTTGDVTLTLDPPVPNGLSGYNVTFTIADETIAEIVGVNYPTWTDPAPDFRSGSSGQKSATIKVADVKRAIGTSATAIDLGSVTVQGKQAGKETPITVTVNQMDDDSGNVVTLADATGKISVQQALGSIRVISTPPLADIFIDGSTTSAGKTETTIDIAPGLHTVKVSLSNYVDAEQTVTVESAKTANAVFTLVRSGTITVTSVPAGAKIFIDNRDTNQVTSPTGPVTFTGVAPGLRTVRVELDQYYSKSSSKTVLAGITAKFSFTLTKIPGNEDPPYGFIAVDSEPRGARIFIDGQDTQVDTLSTIQMDPKEGYPNTYDVKVTLDRYVPSETKQVEVVADTTKSVVFKLKPIIQPSLTCLWPPNNKFVDLSITGPDGWTLTVNKITSDEPIVTDKNSGGAKFTPDAIITGGAAFQLRAERSGADNGRVYKISYTADNGIPGGVTTGTVNVCVPHDQSKKGDTCVCNDDGQKYYATK